MAFIDPVILSGRHVRLEPLARDHEAALSLAVQDGELWKLWVTAVPDPAAMASYIDLALAMREKQGAMPFVIRDLQSDKLVGCTRFCNVEAIHRRLEIGYTWLAASAQRSAINTETKFLLLQHAFEQLHCIAVELRTNWMNQQSRAAITRLGAKQDGILRQHQRGPDGLLRDTVVFSIIDSEWPVVRRHLQSKLER